MESSDIVERLREEGFVTHMAKLARESKLLHEAADEIERLRKGGCARDQKTTQYCAEAVTLQREVERLRHELDGVRLAYRGASFDRDRMRYERDEARQEILESLHPDLRKSYAAARGWNCFKENTDGR